MAKRLLAALCALLLLAAPALGELTVQPLAGEAYFPGEKNWVYHFTYAYPQVVGDDYTAALINDTYQMALDEMIQLVLPMFANAPDMRFDGKNEVKHDYEIMCNDGRLLSILQFRSQTMGADGVRYTLEPLTFDVSGIYAGETLTLRGVVLVQAGVDPAALEDAVNVWEYLTKDMFAADHVLVGGDSAGGNLALCLTQKLAAEGKALPRQLLLFSPWTDMTGTAPAYEKHKKDDPILSAEFVMDAAKAYILDADPTDPRFSPLFGDFTNFPPTYIMAGRNGILVDDSIRLKERIEACGSKAVLDIEEKGWHVYPQMPLPMARKAMERLSAYVTEEIYGPDRIGGHHGK